MTLAQTLAVKWKEWPNDSVKFVVDGTQTCTRAAWQAAVDALNATKVFEWPESEYPPVGMVCEFMKHNCPPEENGQWVVGEIRYLSDCTVVIGGEGCEHVHHPRNVSFRPVRTADRLAAEEREKAILEMASTPKPCGHALYNVCADLYDAGYRKEVSK